MVPARRLGRVSRTESRKTLGLNEREGEGVLKYPVKLRPDTNGTLLVEFRDVPEAHTFGEDRAEALARASDALETALMGYIEDQRPIPKPAAIKRGDFVTLPVLTEAKVALYSSMRAAHVGRADLAERLSWRLPQVDRLLDLRHVSRLDQIESAFRVLGKQLSVRISGAERERPGRAKRLSRRERMKVAAEMKRLWARRRRRLLA